MMMKERDEKTNIKKSKRNSGFFFFEKTGMAKSLTHSAHRGVKETKEEPVKAGTKERGREN